MGSGNRGFCFAEGVDPKAILLTLSFALAALRVSLSLRFWINASIEK
jgi:hypothetical protein